MELYDPLMAQEGTPTTKEWLDSEYVVLSEAEVLERKRTWGTCKLRLVR